MKKKRRIEKGVEKEKDLDAGGGQMFPPPPEVDGQRLSESIRKEEIGGGTVPAKERGLDRSTEGGR